ncbi:DUF120 domain-containing protein [Candidatus Woesearchaeota archaeon]|nr:DUF120 domain-containing protein [Candidatus Woesearchaeota archaeon]
MELFKLLIYLAKKGATYKEIELSTIRIAEDNSASQQTISRNLIGLEKDSLIERLASTKGIKIRLTAKGIESLKSIHHALSSIFEKKIQSFKGKIESGLGEGAYYVSLEPYARQFREKLGIVPYSGTLNIRVNYSQFLQFAASQQEVKISGFKQAGRTFGSIVAYRIRISSTDAAIIIPERTSHERDIIEVIAESNLRKKFSLKDNDEITLEPR